MLPLALHQMFHRVLALSFFVVFACRFEVGCGKFFRLDQIEGHFDTAVDLSLLELYVYFAQRAGKVRIFTGAPPRYDRLLLGVDGFGLFGNLTA